MSSSISYINKDNNHNVTIQYSKSSDSSEVTSETITPSIVKVGTKDDDVRKAYYNKGIYDNEKYYGFRGIHDLKPRDITVSTSKLNTTQYSETVSNTNFIGYNKFVPDSYNTSLGDNDRNSKVKMKAHTNAVNNDASNTDTTEREVELAIEELADRLDLSLDIQGTNDTAYQTHKSLATYYNRFKLPRLNIEMTNAFGHVFFVRPSCNILADSVISEYDQLTLLDQFDNNDVFQYGIKSAPWLLTELTDTSASKNNYFMMTLSNYVKGFSLNDEELKTDKYGSTYTGYSVSYGKHDIESKSAGSFTVTYNDDKDLSVYHLHKLWTNYITNVYRGSLMPKEDSIVNKILDYASAVYYILTAADGETILFWTKYYGVYPVTIPSSQYSWELGTPLHPKDISITYNYSFKEDYDPFEIYEFNYDAKIHSYGQSGTVKGIKYAPIFNTDENNFGMGPTMVSTPYIELVDNGVGDYKYVLRFKPTGASESNYSTEWKIGTESRTNDEEGRSGIIYA